MICGVFYFYISRTRHTNSTLVIRVQTCAHPIYETTTNLFINGMLALLRNPRQLARFAAEPALAEPAVEELLRYDGPLGAVTRVAAAPVTIHDRAIAPSDRVFAMLHAANRDPRQLDRKSTRLNSSH